MGDAHNFKVILGVVRMLSKRGYKVDKLSTALRSYSISDFTELYDSQSEIKRNAMQSFILESKRTSQRAMMSLTALHKSDPTNRIMVYFTSQASKRFIAKTEMVFFHTLCTTVWGEIEPNHCILVTPIPLTSKNKETITSLKATDKFVQVFLDEEVIHDPTISKWGAPYKALTHEESKEFMVANEITQKKLNKFPRILLDDPIIKYGGYKPKQIILITRKAFIPDMLIDEELFIRVVSSESSRIKTVVKKKKVHEVPFI